MNQPGISMTSSINATVSDVRTIDELAHVTSRFSKIAKADISGAVSNLAVHVGILSGNSLLGDDHIEYFDTVADVVISAMVLASLVGLDGEDVSAVIERRLAEQTAQVLRDVFTDVLADRGAVVAE